MDVRQVAAATITLARTNDEASLLRAALKRLASEPVRVAVSDGGSSAAFVEFLHQIPSFDIHPPRARGLVPQAKASLRAAAEYQSPWVLYTEPDKERFFDGKLAAFIAAAPDDDAVGIVIAARDETSFATFPSMQQFTERAFNRLCADVVGVEADYCYGPFLMRRALVEKINGLPDDLGWGWRPYMFAAARRLGHRVVPIPGDYPCPPEQRREEAGDRIHRMRQLAQNITGLLLATA